MHAGFCPFEVLLMMHPITPELTAARPQGWAPYTNTSPGAAGTPAGGPAARALAAVADESAAVLVSVDWGSRD
jgi:hypothetical protein